jgi:hypothetical protein
MQLNKLTKEPTSSKEKQIVHSWDKFSSQARLCICMNEIVLHANQWILRREPIMHPFVMIPSLLF